MDAVLLGALGVLLMVSGTGTIFAETLDASCNRPVYNSTLILILNESEKKKYDDLVDSMFVLSQEIVSYHEPFSEETRKLIDEKKAKIEELSEEADRLYSLPPPVELSPEREAELTIAMWKMAWTNYPFLSMGISPYADAITVTLDEARVDVNDRKKIEHSLCNIVGDGITLRVYYMENTIRFQGSCEAQDGECTAETSMGAFDRIGFVVAISLKLVEEHLRLAESMMSDLTSRLAVAGLHPVTCDATGLCPVAR